MRRRVSSAASAASSAPASKAARDPGNQTVTYFGQDAATNGRILQVDTYAGNGALVRSEANAWRTRSSGVGRTQIWLYANHRGRWDLIGSGAPDLISTFADEPPDAYGNNLHHYSTSPFGGPRVDTYTAYATPQSGSHGLRSAVGHPDHATGRRARGEVVLLRRRHR